MSSQTAIISKKSDSLTVKAYVGVDMVLITMNMDDAATINLAGFSIQCKYPDGKFYYLSNRLQFNGQADFKGYTEADASEATKWFPSNEAPFQLFRWLHVPQDILSGSYQYTVTAMYFGQGEQKLTLTEGAKATVNVQFTINHTAKFNIGFTKGYISSQAYADKFDNKDIRPKGKKTIDFDTKPFKLQYDWLGGKANKMLFDFLKECAKDKATVSALIYDCDHPDFIDYLKSFGKNLWAIMDSASLHHNTADDKPEDLVYNVLFQSSNGQVVRGFFNRFQHNKILIKSINGKAEKVFTGSANFSIRGLYVQANNSFIIEDENVAAIYQEYFDKVYADMQPSTDFPKEALEVKS